MITNAFMRALWSLFFALVLTGYASALLQSGGLGA